MRVSRAGRCADSTQAWGTDDPAGSNVVDAVIRSLRRKLVPSSDAIETVRGLGYRMNPEKLHSATPPI